MLKETILKNFPFWDSEKQLEEYQGYKALGDYSPFNDTDYALMEMVMKNPNAEVKCAEGVCEIIPEEEATDMEAEPEEEYDDSIVKVNRQLVDFVDALYMINGVGKLEEGVVDTLKAKVLDLISSISDKGILNKIKSLLSMTEDGTLNKLILKLQKVKEFSEKDIKNFKAIFLSDDSAITEQEKFLRMLISEKHSITKSMIENSTNKMGMDELVPSQISSHQIYKKLNEDFLNVILDAGTGTGKGEFFLMLFGKNVEKVSKNNKAKGESRSGDIKLDGLHIEIKGKSSRLQGQNGFGLSTGAFIYLREKTQKAFKEAQKKKVDIDSKFISLVKDIKNPNAFNLLKNGSSQLPLLIEFFNFTNDNKLSNHDGIYYLSKAFGIIYPSINTNDITKTLVKPSIKQGKLDTKLLSSEMLHFNMRYYRMIEDFDGLLFINPAKKTLPIIYINNSDDFKSNINLFNYTGFSWKDRNSNVFRISLK